MIEKWMKKPIIVEAIQFTGDFREVSEFMPDEQYQGGWLPGAAGPYVTIITLEGKMTARPGDYIIKGVHGEFYPCRGDIFHETYVPAPTQRE